MTATLDIGQGVGDVGDVLEAAAHVGERIAPLAADVDAGRGDPAEPYRILADAGFLSLLVPRSAGGTGLGFAEYWEVLSVLGSYNGAAALGLNMHNSVIGALCESAGSPLPPPAETFRTWLFDQVVERRAMFASAASEPGTGARLRGLRTEYHREPGADGFVVTGRKSFVSLAGIADYYAVPARPAGDDDPGRISHLLVARDDAGVSFGEIHDLTALYGTSTAEMELADVVVPRSRLFLGIEGLSLPKLIREPHWMVAGYTGAYLGIAEAVYRTVVRHIASAPSRAESPVARRRLGEMCVRLAGARALVREAGAAVDRDRGTVATNAVVHAAKYAVGEVGQYLAAQAVQACGSTATNRAHPLERLIREVQFGAVMPAKPDDCLDYVGKAELGVDLHDESSFTW